MIMITQTSEIKGYKFRGFYDARPKGKIISIPLAGAKFLGGFELIRAHLVDNITMPSPIWLMLKEKGYVV